IDVRPVMRRGGPMPTSFDLDWKLGNGQLSAQWQSKLKLGAGVIDPNFNSQQRQTFGGNLSSGYGGGGQLSGKVVDELPDGPVDISAETEMSVSLEEPWKAGPFKFTKVASKAVKIVPKGATVDEFVKDPQLREQVESAVKEVDLDIIDGKVTAMVRTQGLPVGLAMDVLLVRDGKSEKIG